MTGSLVKFPSGETLTDDVTMRITDAQTAGHIMERDLADTRIAIAQAIFDGRAQYVRFEIGDAWHQTLEGKACCICLGFFPKRGDAYEVRLPVELGGESKPTHSMCLLGSSQWL